MKIKKINQSAGVVANVTNSLNSDSTVNALSAAAGKQLNETIIENKIDVKADSSESTGKIFFNYGKNLLTNYTGAWERGEFSYEDGQRKANIHRIRYRSLIQVKPNTTYYCHSGHADIQMIIRTYNGNYDFSRNVSTVYNAQTFTTTEDEYYISVSMTNLSEEETTTYYGLLTYFEDGRISPIICLNSEEDKTYEDYQYHNIYVKDSEGDFIPYLKEKDIESLSKRNYFTDFVYVANSKTLLLPIHNAETIAIFAVTSGSSHTPTFALIHYEEGTGVQKTQMGDLITDATVADEVLTITVANGYWRHSYMRLNY